MVEEKRKCVKKSKDFLTSSSSSFFTNQQILFKQEEEERKNLFENIKKKYRNNHGSRRESKSGKGIKTVYTRNPGSCHRLGDSVSAYETLFLAKTLRSKIAMKFLRNLSF